MSSLTWKQWNLCRLCLPRERQHRAKLFLEGILQGIWCSEERQEGRPSLHPHFELCTMLTNLVTFGLCSHKAGMISMYFPSFSSFGRQPDTIYRILNHVKLSEWYMKKSNSWNEGKKSLPLVQQWSFSVTALASENPGLSALQGLHRYFLVQALHGAALLKAVSL